MTSPVSSLRTSPTDPGNGAEERFWRRVAALKRSYIERWHQTPALAPELGPRLGRWRKHRNTRVTRRLLDIVSRRIEHYPESARDQRRWREELQSRISGFGEECLGWPGGYRRLLFADEFYETSVEFARAARDFDPELRLQNLFQALRNAWIVSSIQMLLDHPVSFTPAVFAYSMLYPYTDNYLDESCVSTADKRAFNRRLRRRLLGQSVAPQTAHEVDVFRLVARIEGVWERALWPEVFHSLVAIQRGQERSLAQHRRPSLEEAELLEISVEKGGASVLADGHLVVGALSLEEADFCYGYGFFLQLLDDLQDVQEDLKAGHQTLFTRQAGASDLDDLTSRLYTMMSRCLEDAPRFASPLYDDRKDLIHRNSTFLLVGAMAENEALFSRSYRRAVEAQWPLSFSAMRRLRLRAGKRNHQALKRLQSKRGVDSVLDLVL